MNAAFLSAFALCLALEAAFVSGVVEIGEKKYQFVEQVLEDVLGNVGERCVSSRYQPPLVLDSIRLPDIDLKPLIVNSNVFEVNLRSATLSQINRFIISKISSTDNYVEKGKEYQVNLQFPSLIMESHYKAKGLVGDVFPVEGQGSLKAEFKDIDLVVDLPLRIVDTEGNSTKRLELVSEDSLTAESLTFRDFILYVGNQRVDTKNDQHLRSRLRSSMAHEIGSVLFWKGSVEAGKELRAYLPKCINQELQQVKFPQKLFDNIGDLMADSSFLYHPRNVLLSKRPLKTPDKEQLLNQDLDQGIRWPSVGPFLYQTSYRPPLSSFPLQPPFATFPRPSPVLPQNRVPFWF